MNREYYGDEFLLNQKKTEEINRISMNKLSFKLEEKDSDLNTLHLIISEKNAKIISFENELINSRKELLYNEKTSIAMKEKIQNFDLKFNKEKMKNESLKFQNEVLEKQVIFLTEQISKSESTITKLMQEKQKLSNTLK